MARRNYTDDDKARVIALLAANEGNVKRTSRELNIPEQTVRDWKTEAERGQLSPTVAAAVPAALDDQIDTFERIRDKALVALEGEIDAGNVKGRDLITAAGVLTDKLRIMQGQATSRTEHVSTGPSPEEFGRQLVEYLGDSFAKATEREADIVDADFEEQAPEALPPASDDI